MKIYKIKISALLLVLTFSCSIYLLAKEGVEKNEGDRSSPILSIKNSGYNFGKVYDGEIVIHSYKIKNSGNKILRINKVKTTCGCATTHYSKEILPGKTGEVVLKGDTQGYGGKRFSKFVTLFTNDPGHKKTRLYIFGNVMKFASISPNRALLRGKSGEKIETTVTITPYRENPFQITSTISENLSENIDYSLKKEKNGL